MGVKKIKKTAFAYIILAGVFWGSSGIFVNFLASFGLSTLKITAIRAFGAAITMTSYVFFKDKSCFKVTKKELLMFFFSAMAMLATSVTYFSSIRAASVPTAVVLMYTAPAMVMIYSVLFLSEKLTKLKLCALAFMIIGCSLVSGIIGGLKFSAVGIIMGILAGISYSAYNILTKIQMKNGCSPLSQTMYCFIFMALGAILISEPAEILDTAVKNLEAIPLMLLCGILTSTIPYFLYTVALRYLPVGTASALGVVEPLAATIFSVLILNTVLDVYSIVGMAMIISAIFMLSKEEENSN